MNAFAPLLRNLVKLAWPLATAFFLIVGSINAEGPTASKATVSSTLTPEDGRIVVDVHGTPAPVAEIFSTAVNQSIHFGREEITGVTEIAFHVVQGKPETFTVGLSAEGEIVDVSGVGLRDWSIRQSVGVGGAIRSLVLRPLAAPIKAGTRDFKWTLHTRVRVKSIPTTAELVLVNPGDSVGFSAEVNVRSDPTIDINIKSLQGLIASAPLDGSAEPKHFISSGNNRIEVALTQPGASEQDATLTSAQLQGVLNSNGNSADFHLAAQLNAAKIGARLPILWGRAALADRPSGTGWHVELVSIEKNNVRYEVVSERVGTMAVNIHFAAEVVEEGDWRTFDFAMPTGVAVPFQLEGFAGDVSFKVDAPIVPKLVGSVWKGFLPANGSAAVSWKRSRAAAEGALFFTSDELSDLQVGAGLARETSRVSLRVLQGKLDSVRFHLSGVGDILSVEGANVVGWKVSSEKSGRILNIHFSRPVETNGILLITSQAELGQYPVNIDPLRLSPEGAVRHSGFVRITNTGAVKIEVTGANGLLQLSPNQFPGAALAEDNPQVFVYRFPSANYDYHVVAQQIQPEVSVSLVSTYELTDTDRVISSEIELDVREAALREWSLQIPDDYTIANLSGNGVADYTAESPTADGYRKLRVIFNEDVQGRQLLNLRLEKNQPALAGNWVLRSLRFPQAKSVRGNIGIVSAPGFRVVPGETAQLVEVPLSYFPKQLPGLQQAWRLRTADWSARVQIEALGQSIQADVFHLYTIKQGTVYGSILLNYFVVGAPANEWRIAVPAALGNIDVIGENVRRDWRREGDQVIVSLHQPVLGAATLLITFEQPIGAQGGVISPGEIRPLNVQSERGLIEVVSPLQVNTHVAAAEGRGLLSIDPLELPAEFRLLSTSPALATYQYTDRPFTFNMGLQWYTPAETAEQVIDFAKLSSVISRDGQVVTDAQYYVKTRGRKTLRLSLAAKVKLWETHVDGELVTARVDGDQLIIPLPAHPNPNDPVEIKLRLGQVNPDGGSLLKLSAPRTPSAIVRTEWVLRADSGRRLIPRGGNAVPVLPAVDKSGFQWVSEQTWPSLTLLMFLIACAAFCLRSTQGWATLTGLSICAVALAQTGILMAQAQATALPTLPDLSYVSTLIPAGGELTLQVANEIESATQFVWWGIAAVFAGLTLMIFAVLYRRRCAQLAGTLSATALTLISVGLLAQPQGEKYFLAVVGVGIVLLMFAGGFAGWHRQLAVKPTRPLPNAPDGQIAFWFIVGLSLTLMSSKTVRAETPANVQSWIREGVKPAESIIQNWNVQGDRIYGDVAITVRGAPGDTFLLLRPPATLTDFQGDGLRVGKQLREGKTLYYLSPLSEGVFTAHARFEMPLKDRTQAIALPTGTGATERLTLLLDQGGWEFSSPGAIMITTTGGLDPQHSGATIVFSPQSVSAVQLQPKRRDTSAEPAQFFVEASNLFIPGPGVVNGYTRFTVRPVQGRVSEVIVGVPTGFTVGDVKSGPIGIWRFDPLNRKLRVPIEPVQTTSFSFIVESQLGASAWPFNLALAPLRIESASEEVGALALAFNSDAQPEAIQTVGLSSVNVADFDAALLPPGSESLTAPVIQNVWRYGASSGQLSLKVSAIEPEVRVAAKEVISIDDDRLLVAVDLNAAITRVGVFQLSFALPENLEIEALSGSALSQWTENTEAGKHIITMHLNGRTLGDQTFALTLTGPAPRPQEAWSIPPILIREATRQTGAALVVPGKGLRLRPGFREKATQLDPHTLGGLQPGTLAFKLLDAHWTAKLGIEALDPWITVQALQEVTLREGQQVTRLALHYRVENAAVKQLRIKLPGLSEEAVRTVRANGAAVSEIVRIPAEADLWEIHFQRSISGETDLQIEFQESGAPQKGSIPIFPAVFVAARQATEYFDLRSTGRIELEANNIPHGWTRADWGEIPAALQNRDDHSIPALSFRVAEPDNSLQVTVHSHALAEGLKLQVTQANLTTLLSNDTGSLTAVDLKIDVLEKTRLQVQLPNNNQLYSVAVNGENVRIVRDLDTYAFYVAANSTGSQIATVRLVYAVLSGRDSDSLEGPVLSVPLENVIWSVVIPTGYKLAHYKGNFQLRETRLITSLGGSDYQATIDSNRSNEAKQGAALLDAASGWLQKGDQQKASEMLTRAAAAAGLDEASNEDARVQLRKLKTEQAELGLNTRRQRLYLDNRIGAGAHNEQLELAANLNPFMRGAVNFDPQQLDQLLSGNTVEENEALKGIAAHLVDQQLASQTAPSQIELTLPERGSVVTFTRSLQVDGAVPLKLNIRLKKLTEINWLAVIGPMLGVIMIGGFAFGAKSGKRA